MSDFNRPSIPVLPAYESRKRVRAARIEHFGEHHQLHLHGGQVATVSPEWMKKHQPEVGWYVVQYEDGYVSASPPGPFESSHTMGCK